MKNKKGEKLPSINNYRLSYILLSYRPKSKTFLPKVEKVFDLGQKLYGIIVWR